MDKTLFDILWVLIAAGLVFMMQAGFLCLESGLTRRKNSINVAIKNLTDFGISVLIFWGFGFGLMFGASSGGLFGSSLFFPDVGHGGIWLSTFFLFQVMFCATAATIVSGAIAERTKFSSYIIMTLIISGFIYPLFGHWAWGGTYEGAAGWIAKLGFIDFAGSTVVHSVGGWVALAMVMIIGPRIGRFPSGEKPTKIQGSNYPLAMLGVILLFFGWFGFNGGSTLGLSYHVPHIIANTALAGAAGLITALFVGWKFRKLPDVSLPINGSLAGLVAITASCHSVTALSAVIIGAVGGLIMIMLEHVLERLKIDDVIGAIPVHLGAGIWGTIAVALFGDVITLGTNLTRMEQLKAQLTGIGACFLFAFGVTYIVFRIINHYFPLRVSPKQECDGLNVAEHGATTEILDLLTTMKKQEESEDLDIRVHEEPFTEVGQIANMYNKVMASLQSSFKKLKDTQEMLVQAGKLSALGQLGAGIAHELNQPLAAIRGYAQAMNEEVDKNNPHKSDLKMIEEQTGRMASIIDNIKTFSRDQKLTLEMIDIHKPIEDAVMLLNKQLENQKVKIVRQFDQSLPKIYADQNRIQQIMINLITNAKDEMEKNGGGAITIGTSIKKLGRRKADLRAEITVKNDGPPISDKVIEKLFDPFFTTKEPGKGTGLGLSICYGIVKDHGGEILVSNKEDGVEFAVTLPVMRWER